MLPCDIRFYPAVTLRCFASRGGDNTHTPHWQDGDLSTLHLYHS